MKGTTTTIPHPASTRFDSSDEGTVEFPNPTAKRRRLELQSQTHGNGSPAASKTSPRKRRQQAEVPDSDDEQDGLGHNETGVSATQLETALPAVLTDVEAIEAYEAYKAAQAEDVVGDGSLQ